MSRDEIQDSVREYILEAFLPGVSASELTSTTPLITGGILDSLGTIKLVAFLEQRYNVQLQAREASVDHLDTIADISNLVASKL